MQNSEGMSHNDKELLKRRDAKSKGAAVSIPLCVDPDRRRRCLDDPQLFLKTYFIFSKLKKPTTPQGERGNTWESVRICEITLWLLGDVGRFLTK